MPPEPEKMNPSTPTVPGETRRNRLLSIIEIGVIVLLACVPLFVTFPYRINIFLSWEGAYRMSEGHLPYRDFGMPLGYMFWVVPAMFFKIFGAQLITLVKAQVLLNIISGLAFRSILKSVKVQPGIRLLSVLVYCLSFSFFNFWPWYNHTVIVYEMIALAFVMRAIMADHRLNWLILTAGAFFTVCSFFTKQDGGGLTFMLCAALLFYQGLSDKKWKPLLVYVIAFFILLTAFILPLTKYSFGYWFNYGQAPHTSRFSAFDIVDEFFYSSQWIKFYLVVIALIVFAHYKSWRDLQIKKRDTVFFLLTLGILVEAAILQVTSYTPPDGNIFFHSFAFAFILDFIATRLQFNFSLTKTLSAGILCVLLWWSGSYWKYIQRVAERVLPAEQVQQPGGENMVNRKTFVIQDDHKEIPMSQWTFTNLRSFEKIYMPEPTVRGIERVMAMEIRKKPGLKVLNMTELTPLAAEMPFELEKNPAYPLWFHLGVGMFNREAKMFEERIVNKHYDLVLFEYIPYLNNFYPFRVRDSLMVHYSKVDSFPPPRRGDGRGQIEVYVR